MLVSSGLRFNSQLKLSFRMTLSIVCENCLTAVRAEVMSSAAMAMVLRPADAWKTYWTVSRMSRSNLRSSANLCVAIVHN